MTLTTTPPLKPTFLDQATAVIAHGFCGILIVCNFTGCFGVENSSPMALEANFCEGACSPLPVIVHNRDTAEVVSGAIVRVMEWRGSQWVSALECGSEAAGQESLPSEDVVSGCFLNGQTGFYQFTVFAPGYDMLERRIRFNAVDSVDAPFLCECIENNAVDLQLTPLTLDKAP
jgi:hypothetical protein